MKTFYFLVFFLSLSTFLHSQEIETLKRSLDSLSQLKVSYRQKIAYIDEEYSRISKLYNQKLFEQPDSNTYVPIFNTKLYKAPSDLTEIANIKAGDKVKVLDQTTYLYKSTGKRQSFYKVSYNDVIGWVIKETIIPIVEYQKKLKLAEERIKEDQAAAVNYKADLIKTFGATNAQRIMDRKIWLGMTDKMARASLGTPEKINRDVGAWGVHEQWVYGDTYLYFENGILTSWQE
jgi:hypothetical protein